MSAAGVQVEPLSSQLRKFFNIRDEVGVLVRYVRRGSAAEESGLRAGDVITQIGKEPIRMRRNFGAFRKTTETKIRIPIIRARNIEMVDLYMWVRIRTRLDLRMWTAYGTLVLMACALGAVGCSSRADIGEPSGAPKPVRTALGPFVEELRGNEFYDSSVFLNDVELEAGPEKNVMFAVGVYGTKLLVISRTADVAPEPNKLFDIRGVIRSSPSPSVMRHTWKLTKKQSAGVSTQGVVIYADTIRPQEIARP